MFLYHPYKAAAPTTINTINHNKIPSTLKLKNPVNNNNNSFVPGSTGKLRIGEIALNIPLNVFITAPDIVEKGAIKEGLITLVVLFVFVIVVLVFVVVFTGGTVEVDVVRAASSVMLIMAVE